MNKLKYLLIVIALAFLSVVNASAIDYVFTEGENTVTAYKSVNATYTVKNTGKVLIETKETYTDVSIGDAKFSYTYVSGAAYQFRYEIEAKSGDVIKMSLGFNMQTSVRITELASSKISVELVSVGPTENKAFSWNTAGHVSVMFNTPVMLSGVSLKANGKSYSADQVNSSMGNVGFNITYALTQAMADGLKQGADFTIEITGIADVNDPTNLYNGDGKLVIRYKAPFVQHNYVEATMNGTKLNSGTVVTNVKFDSFYPEDGEDGVITFVFDDNISSVGDCYLSMGILDQDPLGKYYRESLRPVIKGNTLTLDFRGKLRTLVRMFPLIDVGNLDPNDRMNAAFDTSHISLRIGNIKDSNGNPFYTNIQGNVGSYSFVFNYNEIEDFIAMDGDNIAEGDPVSGKQDVSFWISEPLKKVNSVRVVYMVEEVIEEAKALGSESSVLEEDEQEEDPAPALVPMEVYIPSSAITVAPDPEGGVILSFTMPELPDAVKDESVRVIMDVTTESGMPHDLVMNFIYSGETVSGISSITAPTLSATAAYNLAGQRVSPSTKGIVIVNGKKVIVK